MTDNTTVRYNKMVKRKNWTQTDPMDAKILVLTTLSHKIQNDKRAENFMPAL